MKGTRFINMKRIIPASVYLIILGKEPRQSALLCLMADIKLIRASYKLRHVQQHSGLLGRMREITFPPVLPPALAGTRWLKGWALMTAATGNRKWSMSDLPEFTKPGILMVLLILKIAVLFEKELKTLTNTHWMVGLSSHFRNAFPFQGFLLPRESIWPHLPGWVWGLQLSWRDSASSLFMLCSSWVSAIHSQKSPELSQNSLKFPYTSSSRSFLETSASTDFRWKLRECIFLPTHRADRVVAQPAAVTEKSLLCLDSNFCCTYAEKEKWKATNPRARE